MGEGFPEATDRADGPLPMLAAGKHTSQHVIQKVDPRRVDHHAVGGKHQHCGVGMGVDQLSNGIVARDIEVSQGAVELGVLSLGNRAFDAGTVPKTMPASMGGGETNDGQLPGAGQQPLGEFGGATRIVQHFLSEAEQLLDAPWTVSLV